MPDVLSDSAEAATGASTGGQRWRLSRLSVIVLIVLAAATAAMSLLADSMVQDQQDRLLRERAREVALTLSSTIAPDKASLALLAGVPGRADGSHQKFAAAAKPFLSQGVTAVGVAAVRGHAVRVVDGIGAGPQAGQPVGRALSAIRQALATRNLTTALIHEHAGSVLIIAAPGPAGTVAYEQSPVDPTQPILSTPGSPYSELNLAVYASPRPDPAQLILTTTRQPLAGSVNRQGLAVGSSHWLLLISSKRPLVGSFTARMPWIALAVGVLLTLIVTALVEMLARRRSYAMALVEQRTQELRRALDEQVRLELEQRKARDAADAANRAKSEFLSRMSHELRTPLNAIIGFGQLLQMDQEDGSQSEPVEHILKGGRHLLELINEVLELSRIEAGQLQISPEPVPLPETVREAVALVGPLAANRDITVTTNTDALAGDGHVVADRQRLKQVLLNLLSNAIKYNRQGGRVELSFERPDNERTRIIVADTGIGIATDQLAGVFEPFERLGAERSEIEGTGLGLALSKRLVEAMGGSIELQSETGKGTTVTIELLGTDPPMTDETAGPHCDPLLGALSSPDGRSHKILYIEDNLSNLTLVRRILERQPTVELIPAMQGTLGLELALEHQPDLVILDLHLPGMPGEEVLRRLKANHRTREIPVLVLSADASPRQADRMLRSGATDYLTKPLDVHRFLEAVAANLPTESKAQPGYTSTRS